MSDMNKKITAALAALTATVLFAGCSVPVDDGGDKQGNDKGNHSKAEYTTAQQNAIRAAESYLDLTGFSKAGLIDQLSSPAGDQYPERVAVFAVNHIDVDWNEQAVRSAKSYLDMMAFSRAGLIDQLSSDAGDQYTVEQATYAADKVLR